MASKYIGRLYKPTDPSSYMLTFRVIARVYPNQYTCEGIEYNKKLYPYGISTRKQFSSIYLNSCIDITDEWNIKQDIKEIIEDD